MWAIHWSQVGGTAFQWYISCSVWAFASAWENECDKEDSRGPYNHDPEKVAICKQFLKGTCSSLDCRLTHKVISEQLPDCLNFLLGFCTLKGCPYRHVNVSPNTPICDGFLKEFLLMVISVIKRHTYVCAQYASTGYCSERSTCKLQHPKKKIKSKPPSNAQWWMPKLLLGVFRGFGSFPISIYRCGSKMVEWTRVSRVYSLFGPMCHGVGALRVIFSGLQWKSWNQMYILNDWHKSRFLWKPSQISDSIKAVSFQIIEMGRGSNDVV